MKRRDAACTFGPLLNAFVHGIRERCSRRRLLQGEAEEGDEVGEASGLGAAFDFVRGGGGEGFPEVVFGPGGLLIAALLFEFFGNEAFLGMQDVAQIVTSGRRMAEALMVEAVLPEPWTLLSKAARFDQPSGRLRLATLREK